MLRHVYYTQPAIRHSFNFLNEARQPHLFLTETERFLDSNGELAIKRLVRLVRGQIQTVETI